jgi:hypothetical protein
MIEMSQPYLVQQILQDLALLPPNGTTTKPSKYMPKTVDTPAASTVILERNPEGEPHKETWSYRSVIGKLNYLEKSSRPDLAYLVHNAARFSSDPKTRHSQAVKRIGRYLLGTQDKGIIFEPDPTRSLEVFSDADFCGLYDPETALYDPVTSKPRTGFIIKFMDVLLFGQVLFRLKQRSRLVKQNTSVVQKHLIQLFRSCNCSRKCSPVAL